MSILLSVSQETSSEDTTTKTSSNRNSPSTFSNLFFPVVPKNETSFVQFLFWHSIVLTSTTPLSRFFKNSWDGKLIIPTILNYFGIPQVLMGRPAIDTYLAYDPSPKTDRAFGPHAFFGLLWIVTAYLHICCRHRFQTKASKRMTGIFAVFAFIGHQVCSALCLVINPMNQHVVPWTMLMTNCSVSTGYFLLGMYALEQKNMEAHKDAMTRCFLYSIEGAGTIRTVGFIMALFGTGPTFCQQMYGGCAARCVLQYIHRLIWIRALTIYYTGIYTKSYVAGKIEKESSSTWTMYMSNVRFATVFSVGIITAFFVMDNPEQFFDKFLLASNGSKCFATFLALSVSVQTVLVPDSPVLVELVRRDRQHNKGLMSTMRKIPSSDTESSHSAIRKSKNFGGKETGSLDVVQGTMMKMDSMRTIHCRQRTSKTNDLDPSVHAPAA